MKGSKNIIFVVGSAVFALALAVVGVLLTRSMSQLKGTQAELENRLADLKGFYRKPVFPSPGNVTKEEENMQLLTRLLREILAVASAGQAPSEERTPATFMNLLEEQKNRLTADAAAARTVLPADFTFGFDRYFAAGSALPAFDDVPRLSQQLAMVNDLCMILFEEKASELLAIERDEFEAAGGGRSGPSRRPPGRLCVRSGDALALAGALGEDDLFARLHFVLEFKAREKAVMAILNRLARTAVVVGVTLTKEVPDIKPVRLPGEERAPADEEAGPVSARLSPAATNLASVPRQARLVSGAGVEAPMRVALEMDVYRFRRIEPKP